MKDLSHSQKNPNLQCESHRYPLCTTSTHVLLKDIVMFNITTIKIDLLLQMDQLPSS